MSENSKEIDGWIIIFQIFGALFVALTILSISWNISLAIGFFALSACMFISIRILLDENVMKDIDKELNEIKKKMNESEMGGVENE